MASDAPAEARRPSPIAGHGRFATTAVADGDHVITFAVDVEHPDDLGLVNHSCDPNLGWISGRTLVARRDIAAEDELTVDYATFVADPDYVLWCHCDTYRCRQAVEGSDWKIPQLQLRYRGRWSPRVQRLIDDAG